MLCNRRPLTTFTVNSSCLIEDLEKVHLHKLDIYVKYPLCSLSPQLLGKQKHLRFLLLECGFAHSCCADLCRIQTVIVFFINPLAPQLVTGSECSLLCETSPELA